MDLDIDVSRLRLLKADHQSQQYRLEDNLLKYFPEQISQYQGFITAFKADMETLAAHPHPIITEEKGKPQTEDKEQPAADAPEAPAPAAADSQAPAAVEVRQGFAGMEINGQLFTDRAEAGKALLDACKEVKVGETVDIGTYRGFSMSLSHDGMFDGTKLILKGEMTYRVELSDAIIGNLTRIDNELERMPERLQAAEAHLQNLFQHRGPCALGAQLFLLGWSVVNIEGNIQLGKTGRLHP